MTELYLLDGALSPVFGPIDDYVSLVWNERYYECGSFSLVLRMTDALFSAMETAQFLSVSGRSCLGRIEKRSYQGQDGSPGKESGEDAFSASRPVSGSGVFSVSGRMAESLLCDRIISRGTRALGELALTVETIVASNACEAAGTRQIPLLTLGAHAVLSDADGEDYTVDDVPGGQQLDEWVRKSLAAVGASYRILPDYEQGCLVFSVYRGLDRTQTQNENGYAIFSTSFATIGALDYLSDSTDYKNFAYVAGEGEGDARVVVTIDARTDADEPLRELYIDARDLRSDDGEHVLSAEAYRNLLLTRGRQRLSEHAFICSLNGTAASYTIGDGNSQFFSYPSDVLPPVGSLMTEGLRADVDYALGDLCDIASDTLHMTWSERITEICYIYEGTFCHVETRFGTAYPDIKAYIRRMIGKA